MELTSPVTDACWTAGIEPLPGFVKFLHPVGISTLKYGVTIPIEAQTERMYAIGKGGKVPEIVFQDT